MTEPDIGQTKSAKVLPVLCCLGLVSFVSPWLITMDWGVTRPLYVWEFGEHIQNFGWDAEDLAKLALEISLVGALAAAIGIVAYRRLLGARPILPRLHLVAMVGALLVAYAFLLIADLWTFSAAVVFTDDLACWRRAAWGSGPVMRATAVLASLVSAWKAMQFGRRSRHGAQGLTGSTPGRSGTRMAEPDVGQTSSAKVLPVLCCLGLVSFVSPWLASHGWGASRLLWVWGVVNHLEEVGYQLRSLARLARDVSLVGALAAAVGIVAYRRVLGARPTLRRLLLLAMVVALLVAYALLLNADLRTFRSAFSTDNYYEALWMRVAEASGPVMRATAVLASLVSAWKAMRFGPAPS